MYCRFCGKELADGSRFCGFCGKEQLKNNSVIQYNSKAIIYCVLSLFFEITLMIASFLKLINIEFHFKVGMWGVYSIEKKTMSMSALDIINMVTEANNLSYTSNSADGYFTILSIVSSLIILEVLVCAVYMITYVARYSYKGGAKNKDIFGVNYIRYSSIPSVISTILVFTLILLGSRETNEYNEYISVMPTLGSVLIVLCTIAHFIINVLSKNLQRKNNVIKPFTFNEQTCKMKNMDTTPLNAWYCQNCGMLNMAASQKCYNCGSLKE